MLRGLWASCCVPREGRVPTPPRGPGAWCRWVENTTPRGMKATGDGDGLGVPTARSVRARGSQRSYVSVSLEDGCCSGCGCLRKTAGRTTFQPGRARLPEASVLPRAGLGQGLFWLWAKAGVTSSLHGEVEARWSHRDRVENPRQLETLRSGKGRARPSGPAQLRPWRTACPVPTAPAGQGRHSGVSFLAWSSPCFWDPPSLTRPESAVTSGRRSPDDRRARPRPPGAPLGSLTPQLWSGHVNSVGL